MPNPDIFQRTDRITVYGADWCGDCSRTKSWLDASGTPYAWVDRDADPAVRAWLAAAGYLAIPVVSCPTARCSSSRPTGSSPRRSRRRATSPSRRPTPARPRRAPEQLVGLVAQERRAAAPPPRRRAPSPSSVLVLDIAAREHAQHPRRRRLHDPLLARVRVDVEERHRVDLVGRAVGPGERAGPRLVLVGRAGGRQRQAERAEQLADGRRECSSGHLRRG